MTHLTPMLSYDPTKESMDPDQGNMRHLDILFRINDHTNGDTESFKFLHECKMQTALTQNEEVMVLEQATPMVTDSTFRRTRQQAMLDKALGSLCKKLFENRDNAREGDSWEYHIMSSSTGHHIKAVFIWDNLITHKKAILDVLVRYDKRTDAADTTIKAYSINDIGYLITSAKIEERKREVENMLKGCSPSSILRGDE
jgi:hypothetical protein